MRAVCCLLALLMTLQGCVWWDRLRSPPGPPPPPEGIEPGQMAPQIEGPDLDGVPFKLSDYRGQVVVLDFWGHW